MSDRARGERTTHDEGQRTAKDGGRRGDALPAAIARAWEPMLGSLADVRVHTGPASGALARDLDARAVTVGSDIHFAENAYRPDTGQGRELIAHEVRHTAQPNVPNARDVAPVDHPAERELDASALRGRPRAQRAGLHRFLPPPAATSGLRPGELLPAPHAFVHAVDRFNIALQIDTNRVLQIVVTAQGELPVSGPRVVDRVLRLPVLELDGTVACQIVDRLDNSVAYDVYGDGREIVRIGDLSSVGPGAASRRHRFVVNRNGLPAQWRGEAIDTNIDVELPRPVAGGGSAGDGTAERVVNATFHAYGDLLQFVVREAGERGYVTVTITTALIAEMDGDHPSVFVRLDVPPDRMTARILRNSGRTIELDLDGDGRTDLVYDHSAYEAMVTGPLGESFRERRHLFWAFDARGMRLQDVPNTHVQRHPASDVLPDLPPGSAPSPVQPGPGEVQPPANEPPTEPDRIGGFPHTTVLAGGVRELRVDADGDRTRELLVRIRPPQMCLDPDHQEYTIELTQLSSQAVATLTMQLTQVQAANVSAHVVRLSDGVSPLAIDVVDEIVAVPPTAPPDPVTIEILADRDDFEESAYTVTITGAATSDPSARVAFPLEQVPGQPLVRSATQAQLAGMWMVDATLGEFGDAFRFTISDFGGRELLGVSAIGRDGQPAESRPVYLLPGATHTGTSPQLLPPEQLVPPPFIASRASQELVLRLGEREIHITDAIGTDPAERLSVVPDPHVVRTHRMAITGAAVLEPRVLRFDYVNGSFRTPDRTGVEIPTVQGAAGTTAAGGYLNRIERSTHAIGRLSIHAAIDMGYVREDAFDAFRDSVSAVLQLLRAWSVTEWQTTLPGARDRARLALAAWADRAEPDIAPRLTASHDALMSDDYPDTFENYAHAVDAYDRALFALDLGANPAQESVAGGAVASSVIQVVAREGSSLSEVSTRIDVALIQEIAAAHRLGILSDALFQAWSQLRLSRTRLLVTQKREAADPTCVAADAVDTAMIAARALQTELVSATGFVEGVQREDYTGEVWAGIDASQHSVYIGGDGDAFAQALTARSWDEVWRSYDALNSAVDRWVTNRLEARDAAAGSVGPEHEQLLHNQYVHRMHEQLGALPPDTIPVAASFVPSTEYQNLQGYASAYQVRLFVWHDGARWQLRNLTSPDNIYETNADGTREQGPPYELFRQLNDHDAFPRGMLYFQVPGGLGGQVRCTADKHWFEWVSEVAMIALIGASMFTPFGVVAAEVVMAVAAAALTVAATAHLFDSLEHGTATTMSVVLDVLQIIPGIAQAGQLAAGAIVRAAAEAEVAWAGTRAEIAALAEHVYVPLGNVATLGGHTAFLVMTADTLHQLSELDDLPEPQRSDARRELLVQLAISTGLMVLGISGEDPEIASGRRTIVLDTVRFPNGEEVVVARAAGVRLRGVDLPLAEGATAREHAMARWGAADVDAGRISGIDEPGHQDWFRRWLAQERRIDITTEGTGVRIPRGDDGELPPPEIRKWLAHVAGPETELGRAERAFAIADQLAAGRAGRPALQIDPLDPEWPRTRALVVRRLGGGAEADAVVTRLEQARLGDLRGGDAFRAQRAQVHRLISEEELDRIRQMFAGYEVYVTGAALEPGTDLSRIGSVELVVAVPGDMAPDAMAAIEQRAETLRVQPDPALERAPGAPGDLDVEARVVPENAAAGFTAEGTALHRIDSVLATRRVQLAGALDGHVRAMGLNPSELPRYDVLVIPDEEFTRQFGSGRGRSVIRLEDDQAVIYARPGATAVDMLDEASHLAQTADPALEHDMRLLSGQNFEGWQRASAADRLELFQAKLNVEIDAKQRALRALASTGAATDAELAEVQGQLDQLQQIQQRIAAITPEQLTQMNAGILAMPEELETPPWLFSKRTDVEPHVQRYALAPDVTRTRVTDSPTGRAARLGNEWSERTIVTSGYDGRVTRIDVRPDGTFITVERAPGREQVYQVAPGSTVRVTVSADPAVLNVTNGATLAEEPARTYRLVEYTDPNGRPAMREEIQMPDGGWRQRGSESTTRGEIAEDAAMAHADVQLEARRASGEIARYIHVEVNRGGGGFDDLIVEFGYELTPEGPRVTARVRIREIKDYPNRTVPLGEFTAIRNGDGMTGLQDNLEVLRRQVEARAGAIASLEPAELQALTEAVQQGSGRISVEVVTSPTTKIADPTHHASTVMPALQAEVEAVLGPNSFVAPNAQESAELQPYMDAEIARRATTPQ